MANINRREFVAYSAMAGAGIMSSAVLGPWATEAALAAGAEPEPSGKRVLVVYDTGCGSTVEVARAIGQTLDSPSATVEVCLAEEAPDPRGYDAVVVGSAVRRERWMTDALDYVGDHGQALANIPTAYFLTCLALSKNSEQTRGLARSYFEPTLKAAPQVEPMGLGLFAGVLDYSKLNPVMRMIMKSKMDDRGIAQGDYRNFKAIKAWAAGLAPALGLSENQAKAA